MESFCIESFLWPVQMSEQHQDNKDKIISLTIALISKESSDGSGLTGLQKSYGQKLVRLVNWMLLQ